MPYLSVSQPKYNALKKENERLKEELEAEKVHSSLIFDEKNDLEAKLKELLSEDLVAENAKLKSRIDELKRENLALHAIAVDLMDEVSNDD